MIVHKHRTGSLPCIWRLANLGAYCASICCSSLSISMNSSPKLPSVILSSPFRLSSNFAISKAWASGVTRFTTGFILLSHFFQLPVFPSTTHNIMTLTVTFRVAISNIQQVLIPFVGIRDVRNPFLLLVIVNECSAHLFRSISSFALELFLHSIHTNGRESSSLSSSTSINRQQPLWLRAVVVYISSIASRLS